MRSLAAGTGHPMLLGLSTGLVVVGLVVAIDLVQVDLAFVGNGAIGAVVLVVGLLMLALTLRYVPARRVVHVETSRRDRTPR